MALYIGLMSGTSMDGIDAALVDMPSNRLVLGLTKEYSQEVRQAIEACLSGNNRTLASFAQLNTLIGQEFAEAAQELMTKAGVQAQDLEAIGSHGQTLCHDARSSIPYTLQLGCAHTISHRTQTTVVADFRTRDLINGGQGAPFAPLYHEQLFAQPQTSVAVVNVGGIANISLLVPNQATRGWDLGPGNCLMDAWIGKHQGKNFDEGGAWASQGVVIEVLLDALMSDPFLALAAPKSIGKEHYSLTWLEAFLNEQYKPVDVQATLLAFTAKNTAQAVPKSVSHLYLCGGGAHNTHLLERLLHLLPGVQVRSCLDLGVDPDFLEAMMCAWLAYQAVHSIPIDTSSITGSKGKALLGALYPWLKSS